MNKRQRLKRQRAIQKVNSEQTVDQGIDPMGDSGATNHAGRSQPPVAAESDRIVEPDQVELSPKVTAQVCSDPVDPVAGADGFAHGINLAPAVGEQDRGLDDQVSASSAGNGESLAATANVSAFNEPGEQDSNLAFRPFPVDCLPIPVRTFVQTYAEALDCDESQLALPALAVMAGAIGNSAVIRLNEIWTEPAILWTAIIGNSGTRKTPPIYAATQPMWIFQTWQMSTYPQRMQMYEVLQEVHRKQFREAVANKQQPPVAPRRPLEHRCLASDVAIEPLALMLQQFPRGVMVCRDELDGWLGSFDVGRGGRGSGPAQWLQFHGGRPLLIDRRSGMQRTIRVPYASVSLTGGIQPEILASRLTRSHLSNGLFARLLFAFPTPRSRCWPEQPVAAAVSENYQQVIVELMNIPFESKNLGEDPSPKPVDLSPEARQRFRQFVKEFGLEQDDADTALAASFAKLEGYAARLALVLHMARFASGEAINPWVCDLDSMERGITLSGWFAHEARRVRALIQESPEETDQRHLLNWLHRRGGQATARELSRFNQRRYPTAEAANAVLDRLAASGAGTWIERQSESVGRRARQFVLAGTTITEGNCVTHHCPDQA